MKFQEEKGRIFLNDENGNMIAEATFKGEEEWHLDRTFVDSSLRGQGVAAKLVQAVVEKARAEGKKIVPVCSYAVAEFEKKTEYHDVLAK
ncbi:MAG: GNAT family N-acetyltransferase [Peptostreptococcaceae bacterium]|nr:GNAT family N-acetyltransferase [Peptostreptococcaceae bacterium]